MLVTRMARYPCLSSKYQRYLQILTYLLVVTQCFIVFFKGILQTAIILSEESAVVQLSYAEVALLISTNKRTALWSFETESLIQVGEKERKV